jgi:hypothetical protein
MEVSPPSGELSVTGRGQAETTWDKAAGSQKCLCIRNSLMVKTLALGFHFIRSELGILLDRQVDAGNVRLISAVSLGAQVPSPLFFQPENLGGPFLPAGNRAEALWHFSN